MRTSIGIRASSGASAALRDDVAAAAAEDLVLLAALGADEDAHVLDHAEDRDLHLAEHRDAAHDVEQRDLLRRGHDDRAVERAPAARA